MNKRGPVALKIKAILFDLGDTIASPWILKKSLYEILISLGINRSLEEIREASKQTRKDFNIIGYTSEYGRLPHKSYWNYEPASNWG